MAENLTVARPYAQAAFDVALEANNLDGWQNLLEAMSIACKDQYFMDSLKLAPNPQIAADSLISLLKDLVDEGGKNFIKVIGENNRFEVIPEIFEEFVRLRDKHDKCLECTLISARAFSDSEIESLKDKLAKKYDAKVVISSKIDKTLIGGAILKIGDKVIDASVKTSLTNLSTTLR
ncbi:MAG: F0F1 ATP synthase subunit delta [Succinatimonas sp.]|jgi:F-type H+-transporting ATPase subunit delta|nr:F0F1 ATP synthase subunit delta [Succinatimonas sp.]MDD5868908.1 F0F1 ATP synthase subunit delta [Succinatimonas sp.]MDY5722684.1 F0F1 ATP synthase subunit delta [Succinivibrio sp.]